MEERPPMETTDKHLEHAEHTQHAAHDPFNSKVAVTMAILAAVLAGVALASHRGHTETLRLATVATALHTEATDKWNEYQAKNIRGHEFKAFLMLETLVAKDGLKQDPESAARRNYWINQIDKYEGQGTWAAFEESLTGKDKQPTKRGGELAKLSEEAEKLKTAAINHESESHQLHELVTWIDFGHLGLELALVFCAVAVLTKSRPFWLMGIITGMVGAGVAGYGMILWKFTLGAAAGHQ
jgi:hypothetical protein